MTIIHTEEAMKSASYGCLVNRFEIDSTAQAISNKLNNSGITYYGFSKRVFSLKKRSYQRQYTHYFFSIYVKIHKFKIVAEVPLLYSSVMCI
jgi:hypothetical protein